MEHLNGEYEIRLHVSDYRAVKQETWDLGTITVWFKEGQDEGDNLVIKDEYRPDKVIEHIFPTPIPEGNLVVSLLCYSLIFLGSLNRCWTYLICLPTVCILLVQ